MISCILASMNRTDRLDKIIPTWAKIREISEIIVVDWSSVPPIIENKRIKQYLEEYNKIKIIRLSDQKYYYRCNALNLAYQFTNKDYPILLKIDADYLNIGFNSSFFKKLMIRNNNLEDSYFHPNSNYLDEYGFLLVKKCFFEKEKGYNENFKSAWGWEDVDLYQRLGLNQKLKNINIKNIKDIIYHIPHDANLRFIHQEFKKPNYNAPFAQNLKNWENQKYKVIGQDKYYIEVKKSE